MLVAAVGPPDKCTRAPTLSKFVLTTGNAELRTTLPNCGYLAYLYCFLEGTVSLYNQVRFLRITIGSRGEVVVNYLIFTGILYSKQIKLPTLLSSD